MQLAPRLVHAPWRGIPALAPSHAFAAPQSDEPRGASSALAHARLVTFQDMIDDDPEERGARIVFRALFYPRWFADLLWQTWLRRKRRREERAWLRDHSQP